MDYIQMTAPCGLDCFNCHFYLAKENADAMGKVKNMADTFGIPLDKMLCDGCRSHDGKIPIQLHLYGENHRCGAYECTKEKGVTFCGECDDFPCDNLHPYANMADQVPHNTKVFNLCLINKMGLEAWAKTKAAEVKKTYFTKPWSLTDRK